MKKDIYKPVYGFFTASVLLTFLFSLSFMTDVIGAVTESFKGMGVEKINEFNRLIFYFAAYGVALSFGLLLFGIPAKKTNLFRLVLVTAVCAYATAAAFSGLCLLGPTIAVYKGLDYDSLNMMMQMYGLPPYKPSIRFMAPGFAVFMFELICSLIFFVCTLLRFKKRNAEEKNDGKKR